MIIERRRVIGERQSAHVDGVDFNVNIKELKDFVQHCTAFMSVNREGFETMVSSISDAIIDNNSPEVTIDELKAQLKFLRELSLFLKSTVV